jgi:CDP-diglyceride synthetase
MPVLRPWMWWMLRLAGTFNLLAGLTMLVFYHECYRFLGVKKPPLVLPLQSVGVLVALFGAGYHLAANDPWRNRNLLLLGFWSKLLGSVMAVYTVARGQLRPDFLVLVFFADMIYLPPFWAILRHFRGR